MQRQRRGDKGNYCTSQEKIELTYIQTDNSFLIDLFIFFMQEALALLEK